MRKIKKNQFACNFLHHQLWPAPAKTLCEYYRFISLFFFANLLPWSLFRHSFKQLCLKLPCSNSRGAPASVAVLRRTRWWWTKTHGHTSHLQPTCSERTYGVLSHEGEKKCSLAANLKCAPTGSPEKPVWLFSSCSKPARESRSQCSILTDLANNKKYRNVSPETKSNSGKERTTTEWETALMFDKQC